jgi:RNA polymerase sigma-70 factor (ECF subfamily)
MLAPMGHVHAQGHGDDAELARRIAGAAPGAARAEEGELYRRLAPRVRLYGLKHLRDRHAAADLVQQVLLMTIEKLRAGELREPERLGSFVFGMCRMVVLELRRGGFRRERLLQRFGDDLAPVDASTSPRLDHERLARCLDRLPERERSVLVMSFYEDRDAEDVAAVLGISRGNARVIRHRGVAHLRECMDAGDAHG